MFPRNCAKVLGPLMRALCGCWAWTLSIGGTRDCDTGSGGMFGKEGWLLQRFSFLAFQRSV